MGLQIKFFDRDGFKDIELSVNQHEDKIRKEISDLGDETSQQMRDTIDKAKVRPQADEPTTLEENIQTEHFTDGGWGVGDIDALDENAKYWRAVNFGSFHMVGKHLPPGTFQPGVPNPTPLDSRGGRWKKNQLGSLGGKLYSPIVTKPIPATNYIEKTINWLKLKIAALTS